MHDLLSYSYLYRPPLFRLIHEVILFISECDCECFTHLKQCHDIHKHFTDSLVPASLPLPSHSPHPHSLLAKGEGFMVVVSPLNNTLCPTVDRYRNSSCQQAAVQNGSQGDYLHYSVNICIARPAALVILKICLTFKRIGGTSVRKKTIITIIIYFSYFPAIRNPGQQNIAVWCIKSVLMMSKQLEDKCHEQLKTKL